MEKKIQKHSVLIGQLTPIVIILLLAGSFLLWRGKEKAKQLEIIAKSSILKAIEQDKCDSSLKAGNNAIKALNTPHGLDSLIQNIK